MNIRDLDENKDMLQMQDCLIELQDFERVLDPRMPRGIDIVDEYIPHMLQQCRRCDGKVLIAEVDGDCAGYATVLARVKREQVEDGGLEYGLVSELFVLQKHRNRGVGRKMLEAAAKYAKSRNAASLRIDVLFANRAAMEMYMAMGFSRLYVELEKDLSVTRQAS